ncbi:hypothetical protein J0X19_10910 [Hymenobacter sp. BT186]|uniref:Uncharacterized protein n=1 Tax=Hymenobacter telluris TaxID=2816474 RepID=A0A939EWH6_9BACT|nr:hypothetical protein [Hymenobacter telluris]MBW3374482.1 hypothetical protein [Hymenobacter norwichensis]
MNPHGLQLATSTVLYRQLRDTLTGCPASFLRPHDAVIIRQLAHQAWLKAVVRGTRNLHYSSNTATYCVPKSGALSASTFIFF